MARDISNTSDVLDSRDIEERIEELKGILEAAQQDVDDAKEAFESCEDEEALGDLEKELNDAKDSLSDYDDEREELKKLEAFKDEVGAYGWEDGLTLINKDYFVEYCEELCKDIGDLPKDIPSYLVIDWDATAENLKADYSEAEFDGETFYYRA